MLGVFQQDMTFPPEKYPYTSAIFISPLFSVNSNSSASLSNAAYLNAGQQITSRTTI